MDERFPTESDNPFEQSRRYETLAREKLAELGSIAIAKAWLYGAAMNLASPAVTLSPVVSGLPRTGFYATPGTSFPNKVFNFLFHSDNAIYAWILILGIAGLAVVRLIQLIGLLVLAGEQPIGQSCYCFSSGFASFWQQVVQLRHRSIACPSSLSSWCLPAPELTG